MSGILAEAHDFPERHAVQVIGKIQQVFELFEAQPVGQTLGEDSKEKMDVLEKGFRVRTLPQHLLHTNLRFCRAKIEGQLEEMVTEFQVVTVFP